MVVGKSVPMLDARARVTGGVAYGVDLRLPGMLYAKVLRSPHAHARIVRLDASAAQNLLGVAAVLTAADFDAPGAPVLHYGLREKDQPIVARERVRFVGEPVALVAAESPEAAEAALKLIEVEYEPFPAIFTVDQAMADGAPVLHDAHPDNQLVHAKLRHGDVEAAFRDAGRIEFDHDLLLVVPDR